MAEFMESHVALTYFAIMFCVLGALVIYYGNMVSAIVKWSQKPRWSKDHKRMKMRDLPMATRLKCYIPLYQCCIANKTLWGSYGPWLVFSVLSAILIVVRLINALVIGINPYVMFFTSIGIYIGLLLLVLTYMIVTARIAYVYGFSLPIIILSTVFPPVGAWYMSNRIPGMMRALYREETFSEHKSDTVIKRRDS